MGVRIRLRLKVWLGSLETDGVNPGHCTTLVVCPAEEILDSNPVFSHVPHGCIMTNKWVLLSSCFKIFHKCMF